ncbi:MAG: hypothetical protein JNK48_00500, partial [Bryobacterales bacterium]|nr:hypothetical protein [Bryobacterales bacterium]
MASMKARYEAGEHEPVWAELMAMGGAVRRPEVLEEARAVARETMRRARWNIEKLVPRLVELGYQFQYSDPFEAADGHALKEIRTLEKRLSGPLPLSLEAWWEQIGSVCLMGRHPRLNPMNGEVLPDPMVFGPVGEALDEAEDWARERKRRAAKVAAPPAEDNWRQQIETWRNLMREQEFSEEEIRARLAPAIAAFEGAEKNRERERAAIADPRFHYDFAPDELHKADISGATYDVALPCEGADCLLEGCSQQGTFVEYLRRSFAWGGFPG